MCPRARGNECCVLNVGPLPLPQSEDNASGVFPGTATVFEVRDEMINMLSKAAEDKEKKAAEDKERRKAQACCGCMRFRPCVFF